MKEDDIVSNESAVSRDIVGAMPCADEMRIASHAAKPDESRPGHNVNLAILGGIVNSVRDVLLRHGVGKQKAIEIIGRMALSI